MSFMPGWIHASGFNKMKNCNFTDSKKKYHEKKNSSRKLENEPFC